MNIVIHIPVSASDQVITELEALTRTFNASHGSASVEAYGQVSEFLKGILLGNWTEEYGEIDLGRSCDITTMSFEFLRDKCHE